MASEIVLNMDGLLLNWLKNVGDKVEAGEIVAEVEADKATVEVEAPIAGVIVSLDAEVGAEISEGTVIGKIGSAGEATESPAPAAPKAEKQVEVPAEKSAEPEEAPAASNGKGAAVASTTPDGRVKISPVARNMAEEKGIDINNVQGTGPGGRIVKSDIENFKPGAAPAPAQPAAKPSGIAAAPTRKLPEGDHVEIMDVTRMRSAIAAGTVESQQNVPHFYVTAEMDLQPLMNLRKELNASLDDSGVKISVNDMIVKAAALAMRQFPNLNTHFYGDKLVRYKSINVGIAVAPPQGGVIYVVARDADKVSLSTLAKNNKEMIDRARDLKLKPEDTKGATFSISNLGPFDIEHFTAIINPPEACVIAVGSGMKVPVVKEDGTLGVGLRIKMTISIDHRVSDGAEGAQYLQYLRGLIENPMRLLI